MESTINYMDKGNLVHEVVEQLYLPYQDQIIMPTDFKQMKERLMPLMEVSDLILILLIFEMIQFSFGLDANSMGNVHYKTLIFFY